MLTKITTYPAAFEGPAYEGRDEDGISARFDWFVGIETEKGYFVHPHAFRGRYEATLFADKVNDRGFVDLARWEEFEEGPSLEERFAEEAHREAMERAGYRV